VTAERDIQAAIRLALGLDPGLVLFRNSVGYDAGARQRYGLCPGSSDLVGCCDGRFIGLEIKSERGRSSPEQKRWADLIRSKGGFVAVVRSVDEALEAVDRCRSGGME
jgi:hypothetical protein